MTQYIQLGCVTASLAGTRSGSRHRLQLLRPLQHRHPLQRRRHQSKFTTTHTTTTYTTTSTYTSFEREFKCTSWFFGIGSPHSAHHYHNEFIGMSSTSSPTTTSHSIIRLVHRFLYPYPFSYIVGYRIVTFSPLHILHLLPEQA